VTGIDLGKIIICHDLKKEVEFASNHALIPTRAKKFNLTFYIMCCLLSLSLSLSLYIYIYIYLLPQTEIISTGIFRRTFAS